MTSQQAFTSLTQDPPEFLRTIPFICGAGAGTQTTIAQIPFFLEEEEGENGVPKRVAYAGHAGTGNGQMAEVRTAFRVTALLTPTRGLVDARFENMQRFLVGNAQLWITDQQTGCTLLILDWGMDHFSMVHLLPYELNMYNSMMQSVLGKIPYLYHKVQDYYLRSDATSVTNNTLGMPQRYIMVQSEAAVAAGMHIQVVGVPTGGIDWHFYKQTCQRFGHPPVIERVEQLTWHNWSDYFYHTQ